MDKFEDVVGFVDYLYENAGEIAKTLHKACIEDEDRKILKSIKYQKADAKKVLNKTYLYNTFKNDFSINLAIRLIMLDYLKNRQ